MTTPREDAIAARRKAVDDLYAAFAPDVVLEAEVESIIARIVAIDCAALGAEAETPDPGCTLPACGCDGSRRHP